MRRADYKVVLMVTALCGAALFAAACTRQNSAEPSLREQSVSVTTTGTTSTRPVTAIRDPQVIVDALNAAGLALCHSNYSDAAQYDIYGIVGATGIWRLFPHRSAVPVPGIPGALSCVSANQPSIGDIEIDVYPSAIDAQRALRYVERFWLAAWLYGNVAILIDQTTPLPLAQQEREVLDHIPGTVLAGWY